ncbi:MAG: hypothetical protein MKZ55_07510 [Candidatus Thalassarchaeum sp.]|nr:hypothetical protein [Candidatus Thalassarchaeum sp.]
MFGKRTYCILGTMLLAVATLGSGVSAEQSNERLYDLEELGILELSMDDGVVEAMITSESFLSFMNSDDAALLAIESIAMNVGLSDDGELELTEIDINVGEEQSNEIAVTLRLSDDLLELLHDEDLSSEDLLRELGFGDDLGLDDFNPEVADDYWHSRTYWADEAYQVRGSQADYDAVMDSEDPEEEFYNIYEEVMSDWEEEEEIHWADEAPENVERELMDELVEARDGDISQVIIIVNTDGEIADVTILVIYEDGEYEIFTFSTMLIDIREQLLDVDAIVVWNWIPTPPVDPVDEDDDELDVLRRSQCERGTLRGAFTLDENGNGTMRGLVYNEDGEVISNMWGQFDADGFAHGLGGVDNQTDVRWKAVYLDGEFEGLWKMTNESDDTRGVLKGYYEVNETGDSGVFKGKWKETGCHHMLEDVDRPDMDEVRPRHAPIKIDADRIDTRPMDISPKQKPLMEKLGDVMDEPLVEDENGAIVDIGDAAAGSTLGTIALLGAGFIRRRITGGL